LNRLEDSATLSQMHFAGESMPMGALFTRLTTPAWRAGLAVFLAGAIVWPALSGSALARGPDNISDVAEAVIDAVVNISTKQSVDIKSNAMPQLPPGSPFEEFFEEFFKNRLCRSHLFGGDATQSLLERTVDGAIPLRPADLSEWHPFWEKIGTNHAVGFPHPIR